MNIDILNAYCGIGFHRCHACLRVGLLAIACLAPPSRRRRGAHGRLGLSKQNFCSVASSADRSPLQRVPLSFLPERKPCPFLKSGWGTARPSFPSAPCQAPPLGGGGGPARSDGGSALSCEFASDLGAVRSPELACFGGWVFAVLRTETRNSERRPNLCEQFWGFVPLFHLST